MLSYYGVGGANTTWRALIWSGTKKFVLVMAGVLTSEVYGSVFYTPCNAYAVIVQSVTDVLKASLKIPVDQT